MEQRGYQDMSGMFPRPGKALKLLLGLVAALSILGWIVVNWAPGGAKGVEAFLWVACSKDAILSESIPRIWTLLTAGLFTRPSGPGAAQDLLWTLVGLYFFSPDLEKRWGAGRFLRFIAFSIVSGFVLSIAIDALAPPHLQIFHPHVMFGAGAAITATLVAWSRQNANATVRLFFVLPVKGSWFFWLAVFYCVAGVLAWDPQNDAGVVAPFGGIMTGLLLSGTPSVARTLYLRAKLAVLRKQATPADRPSSPRPSRTSRSGGPPLRVVYGGLEDELKKRKPPKDKRYLN
jgi:membrane associated rhomboid family serine protease